MQTEQTRRSNVDWVMGIQRAIDYVEEHITEAPDYDEIARQSCSTGYHFQRVFGLLCGYTGSLPENRQIKDPAAFIKVPGNQNPRDFDLLPAK